MKARTRTRVYIPEGSITITEFTKDGKRLKSVTRSTLPEAIKALAADRKEFS